MHDSKTTANSRNRAKRANGLGVIHAMHGIRTWPVHVQLPAATVWPELMLCWCWAPMYKVDPRATWLLLSLWVRAASASCTGCGLCSA